MSYQAVAVATVPAVRPAPPRAAAVPSFPSDDLDADAADAAADSDFAALGLPAPLLRALTEGGYTSPTPIQARAIPVLLGGHDLLGQAQTGTGKTAAFSLPLLCRIDPSLRSVQALVLVPTRELALQVAGAVDRYGQHLPELEVLPIYGGEAMGRQFAGLSRGVQVVVGTPGRVLDHLRRGSLQLDAVRLVVLDEADEMLRMGFLEDVEAILEHTPRERQTALLSATLPPEIQRIAGSQLRAPVRVSIQVATRTVAATTQRVAVLPEAYKFDALLRLLEVEQPEAALIFVRTRAGADELAESLGRGGVPSEALHSDLSQAQRATVLQRLREKRLRVVVATDVAARGLDIDHITHVINFDLPSDPETYVHRIGRTGRAGRTGEALLLATPAERARLRGLERYTQSELLPLRVPTRAEVQARRTERLAEAVTAALAEETPAAFRALAERLAAGSQEGALAVAAAALHQLFVDRSPPERSAPDDLQPPQRRGEHASRPERPERFARPERFDRPERFAQPERSERPERPERLDRTDRPERPVRREPAGEAGGWPERERRGPGPRAAADGAARLLLSVGHQHGVRPQDVVGAIANEAGVPGRAIGHIEIHGTHCTVEIPPHLGARIVAAMRRATLRGQLARPRLLSSESDFGDGPARPVRPARPAWPARPAQNDQAAPPRSGFGPPRRGHASRR